MGQHTYNYEDRTFLNRLVMHMAEQECKFSATLRPDIEEFIDVEMGRQGFVMSSPIPGVGEQLRRAQVSEEQARVIKLVELCEQYHILPFWSLRFDYRYGSSGGAEIKKDSSPSLVEHEFNQELNEICNDPSLFTQGRQWYAVRFSEVKGETNIQKAKRGIARFIGQRYMVTNVSARFCPYTRRGEYIDYEESEASLLASKGEINIYGEIPGGFDPLHLPSIEPPDTQQPSV